MESRSGKSELRIIEYILFFFAVVDNRYMAYSPVLFTAYTLRIVFALKGFYFVFSDLKATGRTSHLKLLSLQLIYAFAVIYSGIVNGNITPGIIYSVVVWIGITSYVVYLGDDSLTLLRTIDIIFMLIVLITLFLTALFPDTMITYSYDGSKVIESFYGGKNILPMYLLAGLCTNLIVSEIDGGKSLWRAYFYPLVCSILLLVSSSGTGLVIAVVFMALFYTKLYKVLDTNSVIITHALVFFTIVVFRLQERYLYNLIVNVLRKDITLTYRTNIWSIAIEFFKNGWLLGYGLGNNAIAQNLQLPSWYEQTINETHNGILDIALSLGIIGLITFLSIIICVLREYDESENNSVAYVMKLYIFVYFVIAVSESAFTLSRLMFWSMLFMGLVIQKRNLQIGEKTIRDKG